MPERPDIADSAAYWFIYLGPPLCWPNGGFGSALRLLSLGIFEEADLDRRFLANETRIPGHGSTG